MRVVTLLLISNSFGGISNFQFKYFLCTRFPLIFPPNNLLNVGESNFFQIKVCIYFVIMLIVVKIQVY